MNTLEKLKAVAVSVGLPSWPDVYSGKEEDRPTRWITYNIYDSRGDLWGDDKPETAIDYVQMHLFMPLRENYLNLMTRIRSELFDQGFSYPEITPLIDEYTSMNSGTQKMRHIVFECDVEEEDLD